MRVVVDQVDDMRGRKRIEEFFKRRSVSCCYRSFDCFRDCCEKRVVRVRGRW